MLGVSRNAPFPSHYDIWKFPCENLALRNDVKILDTACSTKKNISFFRKYRVVVQNRQGQKKCYRALKFLPFDFPG